VGIATLIRVPICVHRRHSKPIDVLRFIKEAHNQMPVALLSPTALHSFHHLSSSLSPAFPAVSACSSPLLSKRLAVQQLPYSHAVAAHTRPTKFMYTLHYWLVDLQVHRSKLPLLYVATSCASSSPFFRGCGQRGEGGLQTSRVFSYSSMLLSS
jgi:hypothetical protein